MGEIFEKYKMTVALKDKRSVRQWQAEDDITNSFRSQRRAAMMVEVIDAPEQTEWNVALTGAARRNAGC
jgi:hypothetical protein